MTMFNAKNWYWLVGGVALYSSARNVYVPVHDADFITWRDAGNTAYTIPTEAELWVTISQHAPGYLPDWLFDGAAFSQPAVGVFTKAQLIAYAKKKRWEKEVGGITVNGVAVSTDDRSKLLIAGSRLAAQADPEWKTVWDGADGESYPVNAAAMIVISDAVQRHVNVDCFEDYSTVKAGINAGTITTLAEIDAVFAN